MKSKLTIIITLTFLMVLLTGCKKWMEFDLYRYAFGFIFTLVIGVIGLIIMAIKNGNSEK